MDKKSKEKRQIEILSLVEQKPYNFSVADLCELFKVETATIHRDLKELRDQGFDIHSTKKGIILYQLIKNSQYNYAISRYLAFSGEAIGYPKNISLTTKKLKHLSLRIFTGIVTAIENHHPIRILYTKYYTREVVDRVIEPYHLVPSNRNWRLIGWSGDRFKQFLVENINSLEVLDKTFKKKKNFRIEDQFKNSFEFWESDEKYSVSLLFSKNVSVQIQNGVWSEDQEISSVEGGKVRLEMKVNSIEQIGDWVITWGKDVVIEVPNELKQYVISLAKGILRSNIK